jgi:hypothetical protein
MRFFRISFVPEPQKRMAVLYLILAFRYRYRGLTLNYKARLLSIYRDIWQGLIDKYRDISH